MLQELRRPQALPASVGDAQQHDETYDYDAFISYSRKDQAFAQLLEQRLEAYRPPRGLGVPTRNLRVFLDSSDIRGPDYNETIERELRRSQDPDRRLLARPRGRASLSTTRSAVSSPRDAPTAKSLRSCRSCCRASPITKPRRLTTRRGRRFRRRSTKPPRCRWRKASWSSIRSGTSSTGAATAMPGLPSLAALLDVDRHKLEERDARRRARTSNIITAVTLIRACGDFRTCRSCVGPKR